MQMRESPMDHRSRSKYRGRICRPEDLTKKGVVVKFFDGSRGIIDGHFIYRKDRPAISIEEAYDDIRNVRDADNKAFANRYGVFQVDPERRSQIPLRLITEKQKRKRAAKTERHRSKKRKTSN
ncbi:MAG: hypothetical protein ABF683_08795 [Sporolactobacillus sp.]